MSEMNISIGTALEQFPKSKTRFSDKKCDENKNQEPLSEPSEDKMVLDEALIARVVRHFYGHVERDALLGPIFNQAISDWEPHLQTMIRFWSSVMLHTRTYEGRPMPKHIVLPIDARHFDHWLTLFDATVRELCPAPVADLFLVRARTIAKSLEMGIAFHKGASIKSGERYYR